MQSVSAQSMLPSQSSSGPLKQNSGGRHARSAGPAGPAAPPRRRCPRSPPCRPRRRAATPPVPPLPAVPPIPPRPATPPVPPAGAARPPVARRRPVRRASVPPAPPCRRVPPLPAGPPPAPATLPLAPAATPSPAIAAVRATRRRGPAVRDGHGGKPIFEGRALVGEHDVNLRVESGMPPALSVTVMSTACPDGVAAGKLHLDAAAPRPGRNRQRGVDRRAALDRDVDPHLGGRDVRTRLDAHEHGSGPAALLGVARRPRARRARPARRRRLCVGCGDARAPSCPSRFRTSGRETSRRPGDRPGRSSRRPARRRHPRRPRTTSPW